MEIENVLLEYTIPEIRDLIIEYAYRCVDSANDDKFCKNCMKFISMNMKYFYISNEYEITTYNHECSEENHTEILTMPILVKGECDSWLEQYDIENTSWDNLYNCKDCVNGITHYITKKNIMFDKLGNVFVSKSSEECIQRLRCCNAIFWSSEKFNWNKFRRTSILDRGTEKAQPPFS